MLNIFGFLSFPFNLIWGALLFFVFKPEYPKIVWPLVTVALLILGAWLPQPANLAFWMPGGLSTIAAGALIYLYFATDKRRTIPEALGRLLDKNAIRENLMSSNSLEERQEKYIQMVQERARSLARMETFLTPANTRFFFVAFLFLMILNYPILEFHFLGSEIFTNTLSSFFEEVSVDPGLFEEQKRQFFDIIYSYSMLFTFINVLVAFYFITSIGRRIFMYRKIQISPYGNFTFFRLPDSLIWGFILLALLFILFNKMDARFFPEIAIVMGTNLFFILGTLYILQGIGILALYMLVRMLPSASIFLMLFLLSMVFPSFFLFIAFVFLLLGLLEFWFNFRKKALHPKIVSNDAI